MTADSAPTAPPPSWGDLMLGRYAGVAWTLCLGTGMHAAAWYILATALPTAVEDVGGASIVSWVVSVYLVASIMSGSASGLLKARYGSRTILIVAAALFLLGTIVAGTADSMALVVVGRALQGLGEGVIWAVSLMLVRDLFPLNAVPPMYAVLAVVWALSAALGPLLGGLLTEWVSWRGAIWSMVPLALVFAALVLFVLPPVAPSRRTMRFPFLRLLAIGVGVLTLSIAALVAEPMTAAIAIALSLVVVGLALRADRHAAVNLFPRNLLRLSGAAPLGIWILTVMYCAESAVGVYTPLLAQTVFGANPLFAGYCLAIVALAWSGSALLVARITGPMVEVCIVAGPALLVSGLGGLAFALAAGGLVPIGFALVAIGLGFGLSYTFLTQRVLANAVNDEGDVTAGALPTLESAGAAYGAALAGLVGNLAGLVELGSPESMRNGGVWVMGLSAVLAALPLAGAIALVRLPHRRPA